MKELVIVYQNADNTISKYTHAKRHIRSIGIEFIDYEVYFEDERMKEQFGDPFEFSTQAKPKFDIFLYGREQARQLADVIIKEINKMELQ